MPPQPVIPNWIKLVVKIAHEGSTMLMPFSFAYTGSAPTSLQLDALCNDFWTQVVSPRIIPLLTATHIVNLIEATDRGRVGGAYGAYTPTTGSAGTRGGDALPSNAADCISWRTGLSGRRNRGRTFVFGMADGDALGSTLQSAYTNLVLLLAQTLVDYGGPVSIPVNFVVASIKDLALKVITGFAFDYIVDSQRRRLPGRGY